MQPHPALPATRPFVVAHRLGNTPTALVAASLSLGLVEADLRLYRGRVEVRHLKSVGPLPLLWDNWALADPRTERVQLAELLDTVPDDMHLLLDLKGLDPRLPRRVRAALDTRPGLAGRIAVCARNWWLLRPFGHGSGAVAVVRSVRTPRALRRALRSVAHGEVVNGFSIHAELVTEKLVRTLDEAGATVMTWPVNDEHEARRLLALGVHGLISDEPGAVEPVVEAAIAAAGTHA